MPIYCLILNGAALILGGAVDFQKREIPDYVPLLLIISGLLRGDSILLQLLGLLAAALTLALACKLTNSRLPGGDCKLLCGLGFSVELPMTLALLGLAGLGALLVSLIKKRPMKRNIPLCTYMAGAYCLICAYHFMQ